MRKKQDEKEDVFGDILSYLVQVFLDLMAHQGGRFGRYFGAIKVQGYYLYPWMARIEIIQKEKVPLDQCFDIKEVKNEQ
jgi:hypothetical protein